MAGSLADGSRSRSGLSGTMRIALIGGGGFIGHHLALRLRPDHEVLIADPLTVNNKFVVSDPSHARMIEERLDLMRGMDIPITYVDARDYDILSHTVGSWRPDVIVHLAAIAHIDRANKDPFSTFDHNLRTLENTLDLARSLECRQLVFFSSSTVYGDFKKAVVGETEPCNPKGIYGSLKYAGELMVKAYGDTYGLPWTIVRPCALYGPRCISGRVTQRFMEQAFAGEALTIQGAGTIDFTYVSDLVDGVRRTIGNEAAMGEIFNITAGEGRSLEELVEIIQHNLGPVDIIRMEPDPQRPVRATMSIDKARRLLRYLPAYPLEEGMKAYIAWYKRHLNEAK